MNEYDSELDLMYLQIALREFGPILGPEPWEWRVCSFWPLLSPEAQQLLIDFAPRMRMELHVFGRGLAIIYNPQRPSRWSIIKRILHDTFRSPVRED